MDYGIGLWSTQLNFASGSREIGMLLPLQQMVMKLAACVDGGYIWTSSDSGANWSNNQVNSSWFESMECYYLVGRTVTKLAACVGGVGGGYIWISSNSGANWSNSELDKWVRNNGVLLPRLQEGDETGCMCVWWWQHLDLSERQRYNLGGTNREASDLTRNWWSYYLVSRW